MRRLVRAQPGPVVFVPTMGALHAGHAALLDRARRLAGKRGCVAASIFVNPTQFGPHEDLARYPRPFAADRQLCLERGVDLLFHPAPGEMYPAGFSTRVEETAVALPLCGASRPGHFSGVCTVVLKLFHIVQPAVAVFGQKDYQQCAVLRRMVRDLDLPVRIVTAPTVRERDGLARSSRNAYLNPEERAQAPVLRRALLAARAALERRGWTSAAWRAAALRELAQAPLARLDYLEALEADTLQPLEASSRSAVVALAVFFGKTRLIDNLVLRKKGALRAARKTGRT